MIYRMIFVVGHLCLCHFLFCSSLGQPASCLSFLSYRQIFSTCTLIYYPSSHLIHFLFSFLIFLSNVFANKYWFAVVFQFFHGQQNKSLCIITIYLHRHDSMLAFRELSWPFDMSDMVSSSAIEVFKVCCLITEASRNPSIEGLSHLTKYISHEKHYLISFISC